MKNFLLLVFAGFLLTGCSKVMQESWNYFPQDVNLDKYENLQFIKIKPGNTITVNLEENPSTGYSWYVNTEENCTVSLNEGTFVDGNAGEGMVGAPGTRTFQVKGNTKGTCLVEFVYKGPGETVDTKKNIYFVVGTASL